MKRNNISEKSVLIWLLEFRNYLKEKQERRNTQEKSSRLFGKRLSTFGYLIEDGLYLYTRQVRSQTRLLDVEDAISSDWLHVVGFLADLL